ncbi:MAG: transcription elongation factor GreA [Deltaproteobacteria bacterium]|nr:transcription elongation factor GreA [Deltaproteobacteria bacterium]
MKKLPVIKQLETDLEKVLRELRIEVPKELKKAAAHGDLRENSEYDAAKQRQSYLQARAAHLSSRLDSLSGLKLEDIPVDAIAFGSRVHLKDMNTGQAIMYELVTPEEVDPKNGKISVGSPIGKVLLNRCAGDEITINLPSGVKEYAVTKIETLHDILFEDSE